jgi:hypothetical protein
LSLFNKKTYPIDTLYTANYTRRNSQHKQYWIRNHYNQIAKF